MDQTKGHILVISSPLQGHVSPLLKLSHQITKLGPKVTFLTTAATRARLPEPANQAMLRMMTIPDCLDDKDDWKDQEKVYVSIQRALPRFLATLLNEEAPRSDGGKISGVIVDSPLAWVLGMIKNLGIKTASFWPASAGCLASGLKIPQLVEHGFIDSDGTPLKEDVIPLLPNMPAMPISQLVWHFPHDTNMQKQMFQATKIIIHHMKDADWILYNCFPELDPKLSTIASNILPIGPLLNNDQCFTSLCSEDSTCLTWLDKHPKGSVIYVAFGSTSRFNQKQLDELALGLELTGMPFLWVAWSGADAAPLSHTMEYMERVADHGKIVQWAPQEKVLAHPSVGCFLSHCGWSSLMESLSMGVPLLCWPYFGDQMYARTCICDAWRIGTRLSADDEGGVVPRLEVKKKVQEVMHDGVLRENVLRMKELARKSIAKGGSSLANLEYLVEQMKGQLTTW